MKTRKCLVVVLLNMVLAGVAALSTGRNAWGKDAGPAPHAEEAREIGQILEELEKKVSALEKELRAHPEDLYRHAETLGELLQFLEFLQKECVHTLGRMKDLARRLEALQTRVVAFQAEIGADENGLLGDQDRRVQSLRRASTAVNARAMHPARRARASTSMPMMGMESMSFAYEISVEKPMFLQVESSNREAYAHLEENPFIPVEDDPLSTFSIDVDTASYSNVRRLLREGRREIPKGAVRIEELVNYFRYQYNQPGAEHPLAMDVEVTSCPWTPGHRLARVALQARSIDLEERKPNNLVFLIDSSGSMRSHDKIELLKKAYMLLVDSLDERDSVAIVTYAGSAGLVLPSTTANNRLTLKFAVEKLQAGGSTAGGAGITLAYATAREHFLEDGNNRVILATDGDFNVGVSSESELVDLITHEAKSGVFLTVLGFGTGNYQDARMEALSNHGNGNYAYIDGMQEVRKVFLTDLTGTLYTVAKDVKFQIEFNPTYVQSYRLIGYENRQLADRDFTDDKKDAGEVGSGHQVTALYELVPTGAGPDEAVTGDLRYQTSRDKVEKPELMQIKVRYKQPDGDHSTEFSQVVSFPTAWEEGPAFSSASPDTRFAAAVAAFGMILRGSEHKGSADLDWAYQTASRAIDVDAGGYRSGFCELVSQARELHPIGELETVTRTSDDF
jgi:Ca-activated chloride channel family protein